MEDENGALRRNFSEVQLSLASPKTDWDDDAHDAPQSVAEATDWIVELAETSWYRGRVIVEPSAIKSGRRFASYNHPSELAREMQAVLEAGALYHDNRLGTSPMKFFKGRGFGFGALPSPHLKVDESTSPDQCLRVYWSDDKATRTWSVSGVGRHA